MKLKKKVFFLLGILVLFSITFVLAGGQVLQVCGGDNQVYLLCGSGGTTQVNNILSGVNSPTISIISPTEIYYKTLTGIPLTYTYTIGNGATLSSCWYKITNSTGDLTTSNTTLSGCANITFSVPRDDNYNLTIYVNDSINQVASEVQAFGVYSTGPNLQLNSPEDGIWLNSTVDVNLTTSISDLYKTSLCSIYTNITGSWNPYYSFFPPITNNGTLSYVSNISDGYYIWNYWCLDQQGLNNFALSNFHLGIDSEAPIFSNVSVTNTVGTQTQSFSFNVSDIALENCWASITNSVGDYEPLYEVNKSISCNSVGNSFTVTNYGNYNLLLYSNNSAGLTGLSNTSFTVSATPPSNGGTGGSAVTNVIYNETFTLTPPVYAKICLTQDCLSKVDANRNIKNCVLKSGDQNIQCSIDPNSSSTALISYNYNDSNFLVNSVKGVIEYTDTSSAGNKVLQTIDLTIITPLGIIILIVLLILLSLSFSYFKQKGAFKKIKKSFLGK